MTLVPWRNKNPINLFQRDMNRFFEDFLDGGDDPTVNTPWPSLNVKEDDSSVTVEAELPGVKKDDVQVTAVRDVLTLSGSKSETKKVERENYYRSERSYGSFHRQIRLPAEVENQQAEAQMENGVLTIRLPKTVPTTQKAIPIK